MGVPRTNDDQSKAILEAASRILSADGADALTVRRIAAEAGCSTMGLYSRFGGKEGVIDELYVEGFRQLCDGMSDDAEDRRPGGRPPHLRPCLPPDRAHQRDALHGDVRWRGARLRPHEAESQIAHGAFENLTASVQRCIDAGAFKGDAAEIAELWWGSMHGLVMLELLGIDPVKGDPSVRFDRLLDTLLDGLRFEGLRS